MPDWKHEIRRRLTDLNLEPAREAEIVEELSQHIEDRYADLLATGATPEEAARAALAELSESELLAPALRRVERSVTTPRVVLGNQRRGRKKLISDFWQDLQYGARMLLKPGFALIAIVTLALGIGVNTALFTVFDAFVLKPLPLKDPDSITTIEGLTRDGKRNRLFSYLDYLDYRDRNTQFAGLAAWNKFSAPFGEPSSSADESPLLPDNFELLFSTGRGDGARTGLCTRRVQHASHAPGNGIELHLLAAAVQL